MSLGTGVFLGSLFLGTVLLYLWTREVWNWRKVLKRLALASTALVLLVVAGVIGSFVYEKWRDRPQVVTGMLGVGLGERMSDVIFRQGEYSRRPPKTGADHNIEHYLNEERRVLLRVKDGKVVAIWYFCKDSGDYGSVSEIYCGDKGEKILERFGEKTRVLCSKENQYRRAYEVATLGIRYSLVQNKVTTFSAANRNEVETTGDFQPCG